jgi:hypothetical protein
MNARALIGLPQGSCERLPETFASRHRLKRCFSFWHLVMPLFVAPLLWSGYCLADDAYDDAADQQQPEEMEQANDPGSEQVGEQLEAGGLAAPEAMPEGGEARNRVEISLDEAEKKDAGRGLEFAYLNGEFGYQNLGLRTLSSKGILADSADANGQGYLFSVGAGVRLLYFTLGGRFRRGRTQDFGLWSLGAELGLRVPMGSFEPYALLELGYAGIFAMSYSSLGLDASGDLQGIGGMNTRVGGGFDYYFSDSFSVGTQLSGQLLFLKRPASEGEPLCSGQEDCPYDEEGSGIGAGMTISVVVGLHF